MTKPSRREIISAYDAVDRLSKAALGTASTTAEIDAIVILHKEIRGALPPMPKLTMAEVEWDEDEHYLAEAEHPDYGLVIMLSEGDEPGVIHVMCREGKVDRVIQVSAECLTLTGRRFVLTDLRQWGA